MTVTTTNVVMNYTGNGTQTAFVFTFAAQEQSQVKPYVFGNPYLSAFTVTLNSNQDASPGGTLTFGVAPADGAPVDIYRQTFVNQLTDYPPFTRFPAEAHEDALDKLTMIDQEQWFIVEALESTVALLETDVDQLQIDLNNIMVDLSAMVVVGDNVSLLVNDVGYLTTIANQSIGDLSDVDLTLSAKGDLLAETGDGFINVPIGPNGQVLTADSAMPAGIKWAPAPGGGGGGSNLFPGADPTLLDSSAAIIIGTNTPDVSAHIAMGPTVIQAKADATTNADLHLQRLGGAVHIWQDGDFRKALFDGPFMWLFGAAGAGEGGPNGIFFEGDNFGSGNNHIGFIGDPTQFKIQNWRGGSIWLNVGAFNGNTEVKPSLRGEPNYTGFETPMINCISTDPATPTSLRHGLQVGVGSAAVRVGQGTMSTGGSGAGSRLQIQNFLGSQVSIGDRRLAPDQGSNILVDSFGSVEITHQSELVAYSQPSSLGGLWVNGIYGTERVLTLTDKATNLTFFGDKSQNTTTNELIPELSFTVQNDSIYRVTGLIRVGGFGVSLRYTMVASNTNAVLHGSLTFLDDADVKVGLSAQTTNFVIDIAQDSSFRHLSVDLIVTTGSSGPTSIETYYAKSSVSGTSVSVGAGSMLSITKIA
jgi:hypothetical protein